MRDYRYEVDERKMDEDCVEYLVQIQKQWERNRAQKEAAAAAAQGQEESSSGTAPDAPASGTEDATSSAFRDPESFGSYTPPGGTETLGELLNSRYMVRPAFRYSVYSLLTHCHTAPFRRSYISRHAYSL